MKLYKINLKWNGNALLGSDYTVHGDGERWYVHRNGVRDWYELPNEEKAKYTAEAWHEQRLLASLEEVDVVKHPEVCLHSRGDKSVGIPDVSCGISLMDTGINFEEFKRDEPETFELLRKQLAGLCEFLLGEGGTAEFLFEIEQRDRAEYDEWLESEKLNKEEKQ